MLVVGKLRRRATTKTPRILCWSEPEAISVITGQSLRFTTYLETKSASLCECVILWVWFCFKWNKCTFFNNFVFNNSLSFKMFYSLRVLHVHYISRVDTVCIVIYWGLRKTCFLSSSFLFSIINTDFAVFPVLLCCTHSEYYFFFFTYE